MEVIMLVVGIMSRVYRSVEVIAREGEDSGCRGAREIELQCSFS